MKHLFRAMSVMLCLMIVLPVIAQSPPDTEIYVYDLKEKKGKLTLSKGKNITNRVGYDNQPHFYNEDMVLYSSSIDGQTDIMLYDIYNDERFNLTESEVSEYSPTMVPGFDSYSVIRQDLEGNQLLYLYHINKKRKPKVLFDDISPVGYHAWNGNNVAMFVLGEPITMVLTDYKERNDRIITSNIGRTLKTIPDSNKIAFERTEEDGSKVIYALTPSTDSFDKVIAKPSDASDWAITMEGTYITSVRTKLMRYNPKFDKDWAELMDLGDLGSKGITRMAVSPDNKRIAIVINH